MAFPFQVAEVVRPPRVDARRAIAISYKLQRRVPKNASPAARRCVEQLHAATEALASARRERAATPAPADNRGVVWQLVNALGALHGRLLALTKLDAGEVPEAGEAEALLTALFPEGIGFVRADHESLWVDSRDVLDVIDRGGHVEAVNRLAGEFVLKAVRKAHRASGSALGLAGSIAPASVEAGVDVKPLLDAVCEAIAAYALQLVAGTDPEDAAAVRAVAHALDPITEHRKRAKGRRADAALGEAEDDEARDGEDEGEGDDDDEGAARDVPADAPAANDSPAHEPATRGRRVA